jgi:hypothetical protein
MAGQGHGGSFWHNTTQDAKYLTFFNTYLDGNCATVGKVDERFRMHNLRIYPNPTQQEFTIQLPMNQSFDIDIMDLAGQKVMTDSNLSGNHTFKGDDFNPGIYLVRATSDKMIFTGRLIKQ